MNRRLVKLVKNPGKYLRIFAGKAELKLAPLFCRASFMQARMDIDPLSPQYNHSVAEQIGGYFPHGDAIGRALFNPDPCDHTRSDMFYMLLKQIEEDGVSGEFAELGVYRGNTAKLIHQYAPSRKLHLFDTFEGFTERGASAELKNTGADVGNTTFKNTSVETVRNHIRPQNGNVNFHPGYFPDSVPEKLKASRFAFVHLDADLYEPTARGWPFSGQECPKKGSSLYMIIRRGLVPERQSRSFVL